MSNLPDETKSSCDNKSAPSQSVKNETNRIGKTADHSSFEVQTLNSSNRQCCTTPDGASLTKDDCQTIDRDTTGNTLCVPKEERIDAAPTLTEIVSRDNVVLGASGGGNRMSQDATHRNNGTADPSLATMQRGETTNVVKERSSMLRSTPQSGRDCGSGIPVVATPPEHHYVKSRVTSEMKPIRYIPRTSSSTSSATYPRVPAQLMPFCDTNMARKHVSEQQRRGYQPNAVQTTQDDAARKTTSVRPDETYCLSSNISTFPQKINRQPTANFGERDREQMSISVRTENGANAVRQHLSMTDSSIRPERVTISDQPKPFSIRSTSVTHSAACGIQHTIAGTNQQGGPRSNALMFAPFGVTRDEPSRTEQPKTSSDGHAGPEKVTDVTRNDSTTLRDHRGCGATGDERALLGDDANSSTPRILGRISEHKGVLYQRIPWDGCIQVSSTGLSRATVSVFSLLVR